MKTKLHTYSYHISNPTEAAIYRELRETMARGSRRKKPIEFLATTSASLGQFKDLTEVARPSPHLVTYEVEIDPTFLFDNQWNTANSGLSRGYRVFDWVRHIYPDNRNLMKGYWLEVTDDMVSARDMTLKCRYCGHHYGPHVEAKPSTPEPLLHEGHSFCAVCLGSSYLNEGDIPLLRLRPVSDEGSSTPLLPAELEWLRPKYIAAQLDGRENKRIAELEECRRRAEAKLRTATMEYDGMKMLLDADINTDNCIYHGHIPEFRFGWRQPLAPCVADALRTKLTEIGFIDRFATNIVTA